MVPGATASTSTTFGRKRRQSAAGEHVPLGALNVDFQEIDLLDPVSLAQGRKRQHELAAGAEGGAELGRAPGVALDRGREAVQPVDLVELRPPRLGADQHGGRDVARADMLIERAEPLLRLDHDPAPALEIEVERDVVGDRMAGPDVDVEPVALARRRPGRGGSPRGSGRRRGP